MINYNIFQARLKDFCSKFDIELSNSVDEHSTHLVTDEEEGETLVCPLSKKVIQAVARHMYIVTYRWIDACLKSDSLLNEKPFEIQGDLTLSSDHNGLFAENKYFCFFEKCYFLFLFN